MAAVKRRGSIFPPCILALSNQQRRGPSVESAFSFYLPERVPVHGVPFGIRVTCKDAEKVSPTTTTAGCLSFHVSPCHLLDLTTFCFTYRKLLLADLAVFEAAYVPGAHRNGAEVLVDTLLKFLPWPAANLSAVSIPRSLCNGLLKSAAIRYDPVVLRYPKLGTGQFQMPPLVRGRIERNRGSLQFGALQYSVERTGIQRFSAR